MEGEGSETGAKRRRRNSGSASVATSDVSITQESPVPVEVGDAWASSSDSDSDSYSDSNTSTQSEKQKKEAVDEDAYDIDKITLNYTWSIQKKVRNKSIIKMCMYCVQLSTFALNIAIDIFLTSSFPSGDDGRMAVRAFYIG